MTDKYELTTLRDIFQKVPLHKIDECMNELTALMKGCKTVEAAMKGFAHVTTGDADNASAIWPETVTWVDDGKGEIAVKVSINDEYVATVHANP